MKQFIFILSLGVVIFFFAFTSNGHAAGTPAPLPAKSTVIANISSVSITVDTGSNTKVFKIDKHTTFFYHGAKATLDDLQAGMRVSVTLAFDGITAASISASDAPKK